MLTRLELRRALKKNMLFINEEAKNEWKEVYALNQDQYGKTIITFAEKWAKVMQFKLLRTPGVGFPEFFWNEAYDSATDVGARMLPYSVIRNAAQLLCKYWLYGKDFSKWYDTYCKESNPI